MRCPSGDQLGAGGKLRGGSGRYGAEFVDAENGRLRRWRRVERDDPGPLGTLGAKWGSLLVAHKRVWRQRTPSCRKMRRTWLRATWMPRCWAAAVRVSSVHSDSAAGSGAAKSPVSSYVGLPGVGV
jgi:hypothetical protein